MALKRDRDTVSKELKAAAKPGGGRNFVLSIASKPEDSFLVLSKKKIPGTEVTAARKVTSKKVLRGTCYKDGPKLVFETPDVFPEGMLPKLKTFLSKQTDFTGKPEMKLNPRWSETEFGDDDSEPDPLQGEWETGLAEATKLFKLVQAAEASGKFDRRALTGGAAILRQAKARAESGEFAKALAALGEFKKIVKAGRAKAPAPDAPEAPKRSPEETRDLLGSLDETREESVVVAETAKALDDLKTTLEKEGKLIITKDLLELAGHFAKENGGTPEAALARIQENKGRGFTGKSGTIYVLGGGGASAHDAVHETVHVMSASGGTTKIMSEFGEQLNEGFTEYFTKRMCAELKVKDAEAYPGPLAFVEKVAAAIGHAPVYQAYMKNQGIDVVLDKLAERWMGRASAIKIGAYKPPSNKEACVRNMRNKLNNFGDGTGPPLNLFWKGVFA